MSKPYVLHFDGSSKPNPGQMTSAYVIRRNDKLIHSDTLYLGMGTSNQAEIFSLFYGVRKAVELGIEVIEIYGDSQLVINQVLGKFKIKQHILQVYHKKIKHLLSKFKSYKITWVSRKQNQEADKMCRMVKYDN